MPDQRAPDWLLARAHGIAVIPNVVKVGLVIGGRGGKGVLVVRNAQGGWSNPSFITLGGGSWGLQAGVQSADLLLVLTTDRSIEGITGGKVTLGADASVAAGPVGRQTSAATDINLSEVYSYSRASGLFAGIAFDGSVIAIDKKANAIFYGKPDIKTEDIFASTEALPPAARRFIETLDRGTRTAANAAAPAAAQPATPAPQLPRLRQLPRHRPPRKIHRRRRIQRPTRWKIRILARNRRTDVRRRKCASSSSRRYASAQTLHQPGACQDRDHDGRRRDDAAQIQGRLPRCIDDRQEQQHDRELTDLDAKIESCQRPGQ